MLPIDVLSTFALASALLAVAPGPDNLFVLTQSALYGVRAGLLIILGLCTGLIFHTLMVALGVAALLKTSPTAYTALKIAGAGYLLYLAWQAFSAKPDSLKTQTPKLSRAKLYKRGVIMNITNPKVSIFFLAFLPQFTSIKYGSVTIQIALLGAIFMLVGFCVFACIAYMAGSLGKKLQENPKLQTYLNKTAGAIFTLLALKLLSAKL